MMKLKPLGDRVVVKPSKEELKVGSIIIPETAQEKPLEGEVIAVGPGRSLENGKVVSLDIKVGEKVLYAKYSGSEVKIGDEEYLLLKEDEILAVKE